MFKSAYYNIAAALVLSVATTPAMDIRPVQVLDTNRPKRRKTGKSYPHSSERQRARHARQIAAGQIHA